MARLAFPRGSGRRYSLGASLFENSVQQIAGVAAQSRHDVDRFVHDQMLTL